MCEEYEHFTEVSLPYALYKAVETLQVKGRNLWIEETEKCRYRILFNNWVAFIFKKCRFVKLWDCDVGEVGGGRVMVTT